MLERFDAYMERCLYGSEQGFYTSGVGVAGRRHGDFITSPEVGPLFADVLATALDDAWDRLGQPDPFNIVDAGTGPGTLASALERTSSVSANARTVIGYDRAALRAGHAATAESGLSGAHVVIANELLDNLPFRIVERTAAGWQEVWVETGEDGATVSERLSPVVDQPAAVELDDRYPIGSRLPVQEASGAWIANVLQGGPAGLIVFDYGRPTTAELVERGGWLRTYRQHERGDDPYLEPGRWDITTDIALDQLPTPDRVETQAEFLRRWGIQDLVAEGRASWDANAARPDVAAIRMRSRVPEAEALLDPSGLGSWLVCTWGVVAEA